MPSTQLRFLLFLACHLSASLVPRSLCGFVEFSCSWPSSTWYVSLASLKVAGKIGNFTEWENLFLPVPGNGARRVPSLLVSLPLQLDNFFFLCLLPFTLQKFILVVTDCSVAHHTKYRTGIHWYNNVQKFCHQHEH